MRHLMFELSITRLAGTTEGWLPKPFLKSKWAWNDKEIKGARKLVFFWRNWKVSLLTGRWI
jgi:hypothetical protein